MAPGDGIPDEVWMGPPTAQETDALLGLLPELRRGGFDPRMVPGFLGEGRARIRGMHAPHEVLGGTRHISAFVRGVGELAGA